MRGLLFLLLILPFFTVAQKIPGIAEKTKDYKKYDGFIPYYWDEGAGKIWLEIRKPDTEILYVMSLPAGLGSNDIGLDRGLLGGGRIVKFVRTGRKVLLTEPNYGYRAVTDDANERRAVEQSFAQSVLWGFTIEAESDGAFLIDATDFLTRDAMQTANRLRRAQQGNYVIDKTRTAIHLPSLKNFPFNSELEATVTLVNQDGVTGNFVQSVTPSAEAITLRQHHSFVQLPDNNYKPRVFDARSGYIPISWFDYSTPVAEPIEKFYILRHRLQKKDPAAAMSEAVKPIVYYLDNGTPEPIRTALLKGARWWNQAFEAAGYKNAFRVEILPDSADPMDIRYNVINWVHRSTRGWSYGASVVDPRTGEIIKGQVSLGSLRVRQDYLIAQGLLAPFDGENVTNDPMLKMALARLEQLSAHEVGHTIGLMHNYAASVKNRSSVMDYPHPLIRLNESGKIDLSQAYDNKIGEWDKLAVMWGYQDFPSGTDEKAELKKMLDQAETNGLLFISDRDARDPGGMHPYAHLWDNGADAVEELKEVMRIRKSALTGFGEKNIREGTPLAFLEDVLVPVYFYHRYQLESAVKLIGGMNYRYAIRDKNVYKSSIVEKSVQLKALDQVLSCIEPANLVLPAGIAEKIPPRPAGYDFSRELFQKRTGLAFDQLSPAEMAADMPFSFLFHPARLSRMVQQETQGGLGVYEMVGRILDKTWKAGRKTGMEKLIQLQTEQVLLTYMLSSSVNESSAFPVRATMNKCLSELKLFIESKKKTTTDPLYAGHLELALERIKSPDKAKPTLHAVMPPGAPIGCGQPFENIYLQ